MGTLLCSCCQGQDKKDTVKKPEIRKNIPMLALDNTRWEMRLDEGCVNYLEFKGKGVYHEYNCELGEESEGEFKIISDTLILKERIYTSEILGEGQTLINEYKMILTTQGLSFVYYHVYEDGKWNENWIKDPKVFFKKVQ